MSLQQRSSGFDSATLASGGIFTTSGAPTWGHRLAAQHWDEAAERNLGLVADALATAGVDFFVLEARPLTRPIIVVEESVRERAWAGLATYLAPTGTYWSVVGNADTPTLMLADAAAPEVPAVLVYQVTTTPAGQLFTADDAACEIQFWARATASTPRAGNHELFEIGSLLAQGNRNRWTHVLPPADQRFESVEIAGRTLRRLVLPPRAHVFDTTLPVDVVYTWVDSDDPTWQAERAAAMVDRPPTRGIDLSANQSRFVSYDELRYSLRSLELYAPWVRRIFLVTAGHVPQWLDVDHPRLTVVRHSEIFADPSNLPTFNSHAIEAQLHRIPGLAEHFLYLNDDVMFCSPVPKELFVASNGITYFYPSPLPIGFGSLREDDTPVVQAAKANRALLADHAGVEITQRMQHVAHPLRVSVLNDLERAFPDSVAATAAARFRGRGDISIASSLAHYFGYLQGTAMPGRVRYLYADVGAPETPPKLKKLLRTRNAQVLCLNDTNSDPESHEQRARMVADFLTSYFPVPSSFEKDAG